VKLNALKTQSGNYLLSYKDNFFFINLQANKILKESNPEEYDWLANVADEEEIEISDNLERLLDNANSFLEDASALKYFRNKALIKVYPFLKEDYEVEVKDLKENKSVLLYVPNHYSYDCVQGYVYSDTDVMFFDKDKNLIGKCKNSIDRRYANNHTTDYMEEGETIIESLASQGLEEKVAYILIESKSNGDYNNSQRIRRQTIYLVDNDLVDLVKQINERANNGN